MKKKMILLFALLAGMANGFAEDRVEVSSVTIPQGGSGSFEIVLKNSTEFVAFTMKLTLPDGVAYDAFVQGSRIKGETVSDNVEGNTVSLARLSAANDAFTGNDGTLLTINIHAGESAKTGDVLNATLTELTFTTASEQESTLSDVEFSITIGEPADTRTVLDEELTTAPVAATNVDVRVKRTITAGEWNTICLPFAMTAAQVKVAFGDNVLLGDFTGCDADYDADENVTGLSVNFQSATSIEANHPYIIKVEADVEEFTVDGVSIEVEDEPSVDKDEKKVKVGKNTYTSYNRFVGTYTANTPVPEQTLFLNGNSFWYSTGASMMKAYRGYFDFYDVLAIYGTNTVAARMLIVFNENVTGVNDVRQAAANDGRIYNLQGQQVEKPGKGLYIKDGKVIMNK